MEWREIAGSVFEESIRIHNELGLGLLESVYQAVQNPMPVFLSAPPRLRVNRFQHVPASL